MHRSRQRNNQLLWRQAHWPATREVKMNDLRKIVYFLISLFFFTRFFLIPLIRIIINLIKLGTLKKQINKFGTEILKIQNKKIIGKGSYIYYIAMILFFIIYAILLKEPIILVYLLFFVPAFLDIILIKRYSQYNGFYSNGIVKGSFIEWKNIFSWKKIDEDRLFFLKQDGLRFDVETNLQQKLIIDFMTEKGIQEEK